MFNRKQKDALLGLADLRLLTNEDLMRILSVSESSLYRMRRKGLLPYIKVTSTCYYSAVEIAAWLHNLSKAGQQPRQGTP
ncbi:MAG: hypothetical protein CMC08_00545 [Flavobacteriaceae bacterium]|nr:hypothetical protein [Flavobacteriaceae bacterium]